MIRTTENNIRDIHNSDAYGVVVESGCGVALSNALMRVPGASNTIFVVESPYSKEFQNNKYSTKEYPRAVSIDVVISIAKWWLNELKRITEVGDLKKPVNFIYAASFQIGDFPDDKRSTHGYIAYWDKNMNESLLRIFHVSIHQAYSRSEYLDIIASIGVDILKDGLKDYVPANCLIDGAWHLNLDIGELKDITTGGLFAALQNSVDDYFVSVSPDGYKRLEDLFRGKDKIVIFKGSFNPPTTAHIEFADVAEKRFGIKPVFMISSEIYGKGHVTPQDLEQRVSNLNTLGYDVIVSRSGFFNENISMLRKKFNQEIVFVVGADTINRVFESTYKIIGPRMINPIGRYSYSKNIDRFKRDFSNVKFLVIERPGYPISKEIDVLSAYYDIEPFENAISSTNVRKLIEEGQVELAKRLIPVKLHDKIFK